MMQTNIFHKYQSLNVYEKAVISGYWKPKTHCFEVFEVIDYILDFMQLPEDEAYTFAQAIVHCVLEGSLEVEYPLLESLRCFYLTGDDIYRAYHTARDMMRNVTNYLNKNVWKNDNVVYYRLSNVGYLKVIEVHPLMTDLNQTKVYYGEPLERSMYALDDYPY